MNGGPRDGLGRTQVVSMAVSLGATGLLAVQNLSVLHLVSRSELGLLGIASGLGTIALLAQYFGVGAATLKEVALAHGPQEAGRVMFAAVVLRVALTLPVAMGLFALAPWLADSVYHHPEIQRPVRLFAALVLLYGLNDVFMYTIQGLHLWNRFFAIKLGSAVVQVGMVLGATAHWGLDGYFYGLTASGLAGTVRAFAAVLGPVGGRLPRWSEVGMADQMRRMFSLSMYAYLAKILQGLALQAPILIAGATYSAARVGDLKFALTLGGLLLAVSGAINTINIAVFTRAYDRARDGFARRAAGQVALYAIVSGVLGACAGLAAPELVALAGGSRYEHVVGATAVAMVAMALYGVIGVVVSTVHIPSGGYKTFVWVYAVPTVCASGATAVLAGRDASTESIVATVLVGSALGLAWALADMTRRHVGSRHLLGGLVVIAGLGSLPALGLPDAARAALALAVVGAGVLLVRSLRAQEAVA